MTSLGDSKCERLELVQIYVHLYVGHAFLFLCPSERTRLGFSLEEHLAGRDVSPFFFSQNKKILSRYQTLNTKNIMTGSAFLNRVGGLTIYRNTFPRNGKVWNTRTKPANLGLHVTPAISEKCYGHYVSDRDSVYYIACVRLSSLLDCGSAALM
jgi:hypothetical protein